MKRIPRDETLVVADAGDHAAVTATGTTADGRPIGTRHTVISEDGKTMTATVEGIDARGRVSGVEVYNKQ